MIVYKCVFSDSELFTDAQSPNPDDVAFCCKAKMLSRKGGIDESLIGANKSAEEQVEDCEEGVESGLDLVLNSRLKECGYSNKKQFLAYVKKYCKSLEEKMAEKKGDGWDGEKDAFKARAKKFFVETVLPNWDDYCIYHGEEDETYEGTCVFIKYDDTGMAADAFIFKDGVEQVKY